VDVELERSRLIRYTRARWLARAYAVLVVSGASAVSAARADKRVSEDRGASQGNAVNVVRKARPQS